MGLRGLSGRVLSHRPVPALALVGLQGRVPDVPKVALTRLHRSEDLNRPGLAG
jgi:hypothetical protein